MHLQLSPFTPIPLAFRTTTATARKPRRVLCKERVLLRLHSPSVTARLTISALNQQPPQLTKLFPPPMAEATLQRLSQRPQSRRRSLTKVEHSQARAEHVPPRS